MTQPTANVAGDAPRLALYSALHSLQATVRSVRRTAQNAFTGKNYADLGAVFDAVGPSLAETGLVVIQRPEVERVATGLRLRLETMIVHAPTGEALSGELCIPIGGDGGAQAIGAALTYARRYALMAMLGLAAEEDDAGGAGSGAGDGRRDASRPRTNGTRPRQNQTPATGATEPRESSPDRPTSEQWRQYGELVGKWRGDEPTKGSVKTWAEAWMRTREADHVSGSLLQEAIAKLTSGAAAGDVAPKEPKDLHAWSRARGEANEAAGLVFDNPSRGAKPGP